MAEQKQSPKEAEPVNIIVTFQVPEGQYDTFMEAAKPMITSTNKEKGCITYHTHQTHENKNQIITVEEWDSQQNLTKHLKRSHVKRYQQVLNKMEVHPIVFFCGAPLVKLD